MSTDYATKLFEQIPTGHKNAMYVDNNNTTFRKLVQIANLSGDELIINLHGGYFKVDVDDPVDVAMFNAYVERERGRAREMLVKANAMRRTLDERTKESIDGREHS